MKRGLAAVALLALTQAAGAVVIDTSKCVVLFNDADRLKCFDEAVKQSIENGPPATSGTPAPTPARPAAAQAAPDEFKIVDPNDVRNTPEKWQGRKIQFNNVRVYWVADNDVRIVTSTSLTLFARAVLGPPEAIAHYKANCETDRESNMAKCRANVQFSYDKHGTDMPGGYMKRTVLASTDLRFVRPQARRR